MVKAVKSLGAALAITGAVHLASAQQTKLSNFSVTPGWYEPPHEKQMKSLLQGSEAQPTPDGKYLIRSAKLQTFRPTGETELIVEAPDCLYDPAKHSATSPSRLKVQTADRLFSIEGEGFLWQQTNSLLFISNKVHTLADPALLSKTNAEPKQAGKTPDRDAPGIEIFSDEFNYDGNSGG